MLAIVIYLMSTLRALAMALLSGIRYVLELLLDVLIEAFVKIYLWDLEAFLPAAGNNEPELRGVESLRARLAEMGLLATRNPLGDVMVPFDVLDRIRNERDEVDWDAWEAWSDDDEMV